MARTTKRRGGKKLVVCRYTRFICQTVSLNILAGNLELEHTV